MDKPIAPELYCSRLGYYNENSIISLCYHIVLSYLHYNIIFHYFTILKMSIINRNHHVFQELELNLLNRVL